jgi:hypothetical protein
MYDVEHGSDFCVEYLVGQCPECKKEFEWQAWFKFHSERNLVECH